MTGIRDQGSEKKSGLIDSLKTHSRFRFLWRPASLKLRRGLVPSLAAALAEAEKTGFSSTAKQAYFSVRALRRAEKRVLQTKKRGREWVLIPVFCLLLSGCGFHPVYGSHDANGTAVAEQLNQIEINPINERPGQMLRNDLIDRFYRTGRPTAPFYHLTVKLRIVEQDLGTLANGTTTLAAIQTYGDYTLKDQDGKTLTTGTTNSAGQYDKLASMYGTLAAHDSAMERSLRELSEQLTARLSLYFSEHNGTQP